jgi:hypothetical protein
MEKLQPKVLQLFLFSGRKEAGSEWSSQADGRRILSRKNPDSWYHSHLTGWK